MVIEAIAGALGMVLQQEDALAQVGFVLSARPDLCIFLDNAEHVLAETARVVGSLLGMAPRVQWLITSREELGIPAELVLPVQPMTLEEQRELFQARARGHGWDGADEDLLDDLLLELEFRELETEFLGHTGWWIPNIVNWLQFVIPAYFVATEEYELRLEARLQVRSVDSGAVLHRYGTQVRVSGIFDDFGRGWQLQGPLFPLNDEENWQQIADRLFPAASSIA